MVNRKNKLLRRSGYSGDRPAHQCWQFKGRVEIPIQLWFNLVRGRGYYLQAHQLFAFINGAGGIGGVTIGTDFFGKIFRHRGTAHHNFDLVP